MKVLFTITLLIIFAFAPNNYGIDYPVESLDNQAEPNPAFVQARNQMALFIQNFLIGQRDVGKTREEAVGDVFMISAPMALMIFPQVLPVDANNHFGAILEALQTFIRIIADNIAWNNEPVNNL
jgi:hypothetical protein